MPLRKIHSLTKKEKKDWSWLSARKHSRRRRIQLLTVNTGVSDYPTYLMRESYGRMRPGGECNYFFSATTPCGPTGHLYYDPNNASSCIYDQTTSCPIEILERNTYEARFDDENVPADIAIFVKTEIEVPNKHRDKDDKNLVVKEEIKKEEEVPGYYDNATTSFAADDNPTQPSEPEYSHGYNTRSKTLGSRANLTPIGPKADKAINKNKKKVERTPKRSKEELEDEEVIEPKKLGDKPSGSDKASVKAPLTTLILSKKKGSTKKNGKKQEDWEVVKGKRSPKKSPKEEVKTERKSGLRKRR